MERPHDIAAGTNPAAGLADAEAAPRRFGEALDAQPIGAVESAARIAHARVVMVETAAIEIRVTLAGAAVLLHLAGGFLKREPVGAQQLLARILGDGDAGLGEAAVFAVGTLHVLDEVRFVAR